MRSGVCRLRITMQRATIRETNCSIQLIDIYPVYSAIEVWNDRDKMNITCRHFYSGDDCFIFEGGMGDWRKKKPDSNFNGKKFLEENTSFKHLSYCIMLEIQCCMLGEKKKIMRRCYVKQKETTHLSPSIVKLSALLKLVTESWLLVAVVEFLCCLQWLFWTNEC